MNCEICGALLNATESQNGTLCVACHETYFEQQIPDKNVSNISIEHKQIQGLTHIKNCYFNIVSFCICFITWFASIYAEALSWALMDRNIGVAGALNEHLLNAISLKERSILELYFLIPFVIVFIAKNKPKLQIAWILESIVLFFLYLIQVGEGGDRKGCESCLFVFMASFLAQSILASLTLLYLMIAKYSKIGRLHNH
jgi:hypothetical protein